jgi:uncharacterized protein YecE (DUF72 family)
LAELRIGTSGWVYDFWVGGFYPTMTPSKDFLKMYSKIFQIVEIDSSFYRIPSKETTKQWADETPDDFCFTAKFSKRMTQEKRLADCERDLEYTFQCFEPMGAKLKAFVLQLPPSLSFEEGFVKLATFVESLERGYRYAVEFRNDSWFRKETYDLLRARKISVAWSETPYARNPAPVTTDLIYLRFIGERDLMPAELGEVRRNIAEKKRAWAEILKKHLESVETAYVFFNNRFEGFGPGSVNSFRKLLGLQEIDFKKLNLGSQSTLFDFGG